MRGSIQRRGRTSWRLKYDAEPGPNGERNTRFLTVRGKRQDAERELAKLVSAVHDGVNVDPSRTTVADHLRSWLDGVHGLAGKTLERYEEFVEQKVSPFIGNIPLQKLRPAHVADWHARLLRAGGKDGRPLSARTVVSAHRVLHRGLELALKRELITRNVAHAVDPPRVEETEIEALKADQVAIVLTALKGHWLEPIAIMALSIGARRGELLALTWETVDLVRGVATIERSLEQTRAGLSFKRPKTRSGARRVTLPQIAIEALTEHRRRQLEQRLRFGLGKPDVDTLVFSTFDGSPIPPNNLSRDWARFVKARKLPPITFHGLRHSHVSALISSRLDPLTVSRRVGHANAATTLRLYAHLWDEADGGAANAIDAALRTSKER
jgi:integrase